MGFQKKPYYIIALILFFCVTSFLFSNAIYAQMWGFDNQGPTTTISVSGTNCTTVGNTTTCTSYSPVSPPAVTLTCADNPGGQGCEATYYTILTIVNPAAPPVCPPAVVPKGPLYNSYPVAGFAVNNTGLSQKICFYSVDKVKNLEDPPPPEAKFHIVDFHFFLPESYVFNDTNPENGLKEVAESLYSNSLDGLINISAGTVSFPSNGTYQISDLPSGTHTITLTIPNGYIATNGSCIDLTAPPDQTNCVGNAAQTRTTSRTITISNTGVITDASTGAVITSVNFGISQLYSVSGDIYNDTGNSNCAERNPYNLPREIRLSRDTLVSPARSYFPTYWQDIRILPGAGNFQYSFSSALGNDYYLRTGTHSLYFLGDTGYKIRSAFPLQAGDVVGSLGLSSFLLNSNRTVNFCVINAPPWFQTVSGDVRVAKLKVRMPNSGVYASTGNPPSIFFSSDPGTSAVTTPDKAHLSSVNPDWLVNREYDPSLGSGGDFKSAKGTTSYSYYKARARQLGISIGSLSAKTGCSSPAISCDLETTSTLSTGIYETDPSAVTDLVLNKYSHVAGSRVIILVSGNAVINTSIKVSPGSVFILAAKGNITIESAIGTSDVSSEPATNSPTDVNNFADLNGIYTAEGSITLASADDCSVIPQIPDKRLNVGGVLIANADSPFSISGGGAIDYSNRSLCNNDISYPVLKIYPRYDFITQLGEFYKEPEWVWREVEP